jgi:hypothetical protein
MKINIKKCKKVGLTRNPAKELRFSDEQIALIVFCAKPHYSLREGDANDSAQCSSVTATSRSGLGISSSAIAGKRPIAAYLWHGLEFDRVAF